MKLSNLSNLQIDVLREIGNIGAGNAATSMSELMEKRINMTTPLVEVVTFDEMINIVGGPEEVIVALLFQVYSEAPSTVYFILSIEEAESLVDEITGGTTKLSLLKDEQPNKLAISALKEVSNIIIGSFLTALSDFLNINMQPSVPHLSVDMAGAILTAGLIEISQVSDHALVINTEINTYEENNNIHGNFFLLPNPVALPKFFSALGISSYE